MSKEAIFTYRIYYEDTDAGGVVYYANYLKFFERARTDFFREKNIFQAQLAEKEDIIFVVRRCSLEYKIPAKLDDLVIVKTTINNIGAASINMHQEMVGKKDGKLLNTLEVEIACVSKQAMRPKRIPKSIINLIQIS